MRTTQLGQLTVSAQGLGCMGMSEIYGQPLGRVDRAHRALELGVTFLDTADVYGPGHNEVLVGRASPPARGGAARHQVRHRPSDGDEQRNVHGRHDYVKHACEESLTRLGVDVDPLLPAPPAADAEIEETVGAMAELVPEGKVRYLGLSESTTTCCAAPTPCTDQRGAERVLAVDPRPRGRRVGAMGEVGVGWCRLAARRGFLTATVDMSTSPRRTSAAATRGSPATPRRQPGHRRRGPLGGRRHGVTPAQVALAWVYARRAASASRSPPSRAPSRTNGSSRTSPPSTSS